MMIDYLEMKSWWYKGQKNKKRADIFLKMALVFSKDITKAFCGSIQCSLLWDYTVHTVYAGDYQVCPKHIHYVDQFCKILYNLIFERVVAW